MFESKQYLIPAGTIGPVMQRVDGFRDKLNNTGVRAARIQLAIAGTPLTTNAIVTDPFGLIDAQALVGALWPRTPIDIVDETTYNKITSRCVIGGFAVSDYWIAVGEPDNYALIHPVGVLLMNRSEGANLKGILEAEIQRTAPGFLGQLLTNE